MIEWIRTLGRSSRLFAFNHVNRDAWVREQAARVPAGSKILDVGAGSCIYRTLFAHCEYKTQDFVALKGDQCRTGSYGQIDYVSDVTDIPVPNASFDVVLCTEVLEHLPDPVAAVREFARILRPGGRLVLTAPLGSGIHQEPYHFYGGFTPYWYQKFLAEAGFVGILVVPNAGFFAFYAQESLRFLRLASPFRLHSSVVAKLVWAPFWLLLLPLLGGIIPMMGYLLDRFDDERKHTVGYHVIAQREPMLGEVSNNVSTAEH